MIGTTKLVPILAAFAVGIVGAVGFTVHAQAVATPVAVQGSAAITATATTSNQPVSDGDGEQADDTAAGVQDQKDTQDQAGVDVEVNDNVQVTAGATDKPETGDSPDVGEVGDVQD